MPLREFQGCRERIERAEMHRKVFGDTWQAFVADEPYETIVGVEADGTGRIRIEPRYEFLPSVFGLELGEFLYQLRAALDASIYACVIRETGQDPPPNQERLEFPIVSSPKDFDKTSWKIPLAEERRRIIESVQPYNIVKDLKPDVLIYSAHRSLDMLHRWARIDRHRRLHLIGSWASSANPQLRIPQGTNLSYLLVTHDGFLEHDSLIAEFKIDGWREGMRIDANPDVFIDVTMREFPPPAADNDTLGERTHGMIIWVRAIVDELEKSFLD